MASRLLPLRSLARPQLIPSKPLAKNSLRPIARNLQYQRFGGQRTSSNSQFYNTANFFQNWARHPHFFYHIASIGSVVGLVYVSNIETVEVSGRRRFNVVSDDYVQSMASEQERLILQQYRGHVLPEWDDRSRRVRRVLDRLVPHATGLDHSNWSVRVIDAAEANAFVLPGNKVFIFTEMLNIAGSDDGIAAVLGHEIGHTVAKHVAERLSQQLFLSGAVWLSALLLGIDTGLPRLLLSLTFEKPGSRAHESEADYIGLLMMAAACYNPEAAVQLWSRMQKQNPAEIPQFLSTHPSSANREKVIASWLPEARDKFESSDCSITQRVYGQFQGFGQRWS